MIRAISEGRFVKLSCRIRVSIQLRESWGDFADEACVLVEKAYPDLQEDGRECIALNHYLSQIDNPHIAFRVKLRCPKSILEAVTATIELESFLLTIPNISGHEAIRNIQTEIVQEYNVQDGQIKLTEMLVKLGSTRTGTEWKENITTTFKAEKKRKVPRSDLSCFQAAGILCLLMCC